MIEEICWLSSGSICRGIYIMSLLIQRLAAITRERRLTILLLLLAFFAVGTCMGSTAVGKTSEKCADCHSDSVAFREWQQSSHVSSIKTLLTAPDAGKGCLRCHSADYERIQSNPWMSLNDLPTPKAASDPVSCSACHRHDSGIKDNLIMPAEKLCTTCHILYCGG